MDSTSAAAAVTRPRLAIQVVAGLATGFILYHAWQQRSQFQYFPDAQTSTTSTGTLRGGGPLHRSNAVRRTERSTRRHIEGALREFEDEYGPEQRAHLESILDRHFNTHDSQQASSTTLPAPDSSDQGPIPDYSVAVPGSLQSPPAGQGDGEADTVATPTVTSDWEQDPWQPPARSGHNIVGLLFRVSEDNARRNAYVHRGCMCNACGLLPIRGIRYRCANCADFDLCETCESQSLHNKTHVFYKVRVPAPPFGPKSMQPVWYPGDPDQALRSLPSPLIKHLARETGFERPELEALWEQWTFIANTEWRDDPDELYLAADRKTFERYLVPSSGARRSAPNLIHDRMFAFYDTNGDDLISFPEFLKGLSYKKGKERLERIFKGFDIDDDGYISRRDCLRIFRTYYVLYKHMHGDVIEGLDQQALSTTETQQLVTGRQPLSSHFGREGRVPEADHGRPMEGKAFRSNGDVEITDGKDSVVNETRPDVGNRGDIIASLLNHMAPEDEYGSRFNASEHATSPTGDDVSHIYHEALLNPPQRVEDLVNLLVGESRNIQPSDLSAENREEDGNGQADDRSEDTSVEDGGEADPVIGQGTVSMGFELGGVRNTPTMRFTVTADGVTRYQVGSSPPVALLREAGDERWTNRPPTESQLRAQHIRLEAHRKRVLDKKLRDTVRTKLFDRWQKRNFYLPEEEGVVAPDGFDDDDDVLVNVDGTEAADSNVGQPPPSARSRSSSKVRFAEDTDDYEVRSNPSTSSRSVPERWGGMEIPDAEKDMGKEILYVVTQQAFNEILDMLFKGKEDLALRAAQTKEFRENFRDVLDSFDPDEPQTSPQQWPENAENGHKVVVTNEVDETKPVQDRELPELLASLGYTIDESRAAESNPEDSEKDDYEDYDSADGTSAESIVGDSAEAPGEVGCRDLTMPQFRPNSDADICSQTTKGAAVNSKPHQPTKPQDHNVAHSSNKDTTPPKPKTRPLMRPPRAALLEWKAIDKAEAEAKERGGWGKLTAAEFKEIWRREESGPHRLDYLGTWIDFCIP